MQTKQVRTLSAECLADSSQDHVRFVPHEVTVHFTDGSAEKYRISATDPMDAIEKIKARFN